MLKLCSWLYKRNTHHESFRSKKTGYKKVIAKKPLTNLYEINSSNRFNINDIGFRGNTAEILVHLFLHIVGLLQDNRSCKLRLSQLP